MTIFGLRIGTIFFIIVSAIVGGIIAADFSFSPVVLLAVVIPLFLAGLWFIPLKRTAIIFFLLLFPFVLGMWYAHFRMDLSVRNVSLVFNKPISFTVVVSDEPVLSQKFVLLRAIAQSPLSGSVTILAPPQSTFQYGDLLLVEGNILMPNSPGDDGFVYLPRITFIDSGHGFWFRERLIAVKSDMARIFADFLSRDAASLLSSFTVAEKNGMSDALKNDMTLSGTSYLATMYGWKMGLIIFFVVDFLLGWISRKTIGFLVLLVVFLFVMMAGGGASVVRAAAMSVFVLIARETGWQLDVKNALISVAASIVLIDPTVPITDIGFSLSFAGVLGILYLAPAFRKLFGFANRGIFGWKEHIAIGLAAQLAVVPIIVIAFGSFPAAGIIAGLLIIFFLPLTILFGWLLGFLGWLWYGAGLLPAEAVKLFLQYDLFVIHFFAATAVPISLPFNVWFVTVGYYGILAIFAWSYRLQ